jgi:AraC-like DNA-binding protein
MKHETLLRAHNWNGCSFTYSSFQELEATAAQPAGTAGIKYVIAGTEHYGMQGQNHFVRAGQYLLVNEKRRFDIELPYSRAAVRGFCITLSDAVISEATRCGTHTDEQLLDDPRGTSAAADFAEMIHPAGDALGDLLAGLTAHMDSATGRVAQSDDVLFMHIAEALLVSQQKLCRTTMLAARRTSTREELYRRIVHAKSMMDEAPERIVTIGALAQEAALSEFHFMRCFRQLYGLSPHQYLIRRRILNAAELLSHHLPVSEVALRCGFPDLQTFSKAFRKHYGCAPSHFSRI